MAGGGADQMVLSALWQLTTHDGHFGYTGGEDRFLLKGGALENLRCAFSTELFPSMLGCESVK